MLSGSQEEQKSPSLKQSEIEAAKDTSNVLEVLKHHRLLLVLESGLKCCLLKRPSSFVGLSLLAVFSVREDSISGMDFHIL